MDNVSLKQRWPLTLLLLWVALLLLLHSPQQSFMAHDEGYYAQQARWIVERGDWITVPWAGHTGIVPLYDRTIGLQWLIGLSYRLLGRSEWTARLPIALASLLSVGLTYGIGCHCFSRRVGLLGGAILATTPIWAQASWLATQDIPLVCLELLGIWALLQAERSPHRFYWGLLAGSTVGLGLLVKSVMIVLPLAAIAPYLLLSHRRHRHLTNPGLYLGLILGLIPFTLWLGLSLVQYGWLPLQQLFGKLLLLSDESFHQTGPLYYLWNIPANSFPWPFFAVGGLFMLLQRPKKPHRILLWLGYPSALLLLLTCFKTRTWYYALQLCPFIALLAGYCLATIGQAYQQRKHPRVPTVLSYISGLLGLLLAIAGFVLILFPSRFGSEMQIYGWVGLALGIGLMLPFTVLRRDRARKRSWLWQLSWPAALWMAIAALYLTGLWGNYSPAV
ncbi:MAG: glycosyltransferase family 39 protein, partial [Cyanobacteria bacterium P01_H01_bin.119]